MNWMFDALGLVDPWGEEVEEPLDRARRTGAKRPCWQSGVGLRSNWLALPATGGRLGTSLPPTQKRRRSSHGVYHFAVRQPAEGTS